MSMIFLIATGNMSFKWSMTLTFVGMFSGGSIAFPPHLVAHVVGSSIWRLPYGYGTHSFLFCRSLGRPRDSEHRLGGLRQSQDGCCGPQEHRPKFADGSREVEPPGEETGKTRRLATKAGLFGDDSDEYAVDDRSQTELCSGVSLASIWGGEK